MSRRYSVGVVTAYGAAKAGGYTGTYSQFCEDLADLGDNIAEVREARIEVDANKTAAQQAQEGAETAQGAAEEAAESVSQSAAQIEQNREDIGDLKNTKAPVIIDNASGSIAHFEDGADDMPIKALTVNVEPVQSGTGDPSPTNVRPISGRTGATVVQIGDDLVNKTLNANINGTGTIESSSAKYRVVVAPVKYGFEYAIAGDISTIVIGFYAQDPDIGSVSYDGTRIIQTERAFIAPIDGYVCVRFTPPETAPMVGVGKAVNFTWGDTEAGTVYGGTLRGNHDGSWELIVSAAAYDMGDITWLKDSGSTSDKQIYYGGITGMRVFDEGAPLTGSVFCSVYQPTNSRTLATIRNGGQESCIYARATRNQLYIVDSMYSSVEDFTAAVAGQTLVIPLESPQIFHLDDSPQLKTLLGTNNIWADCGPVSVDYPADTKLYIQKINAPTDDDMTADTQIESGKYFLIGNTLYLSTTIIPAGDTIIPGTNCQKTNLAAALNALNA